MEKKINIAELLKDCKKGMELDCTMYDNLVFCEIDSEAQDYPIITQLPNGVQKWFTSDGRYELNPNAKCVIFPKGKTTWEGFIQPFKDGDVVVAEDPGALQLFLLKRLTYNDDNDCYDGYCYFGWDFQDNELFEEGNWGFHRLATEEEKEKLFDVIKANGYKWNAETKTLEKLIEPKFKVGDKIKHKENTRWVCTITRVKDGYYVDGHPMCYTLPFGKQDEYELVPSKFDITNLKAFDKVLIRDSNKKYWGINFFGFYNKKTKEFHCMGNTGVGWNECIPYNGNEHLLGTTDDCDEFYKTW